MSTNGTPKKRSRDSLIDAITLKKTRDLLDAGPMLNSDPVTVLLGVNEEKFCIHEHLLTSYSDFFKKALNKEWREGVERKIALPEVDVLAFNIFSKWTYSGRFFCSKGNDVVVEKNGHKRSFEWGRLFTCYRLGDFLQAPDFRDATIDAILGSSIDSGGSPSNLAILIYPLTKQGSAHRKLCRDLIVYCWDRSHWEDLVERNMPREVLADVLMEVSSKFARGESTKTLRAMLEGKDGCEYHEHTQTDSPCYKVKLEG